MKCTQRILLILFASLYFTACQKELGWPPVPTEVAIGKLLVKITAVKGDSSMETLYFYDSAYRITSEEITSSYHKSLTKHFKRYSRDLTGRIFAIAEITKNNSSSSDSVYTFVNYPTSSTNHFSYTTSNFGVMGTTAKDSTVFIYNSSDMVESSISYLINSLQAKSLLNSKWEYNYDNNGNLVQQSYFSYMWNTFVPVSVYNYSYNNTINPLATGSEFMLLQVEGNGSKNNIRSIKKTDVTSSSNNSVINRTYSLNKAGKPDKCYEIVGSDSTYTYSYFYK